MIILNTFIFVNQVSCIKRNTSCRCQRICLSWGSESCDLHKTPGLYRYCPHLLHSSTLWHHGTIPDHFMSRSFKPCPAVCQFNAFAACVWCWVCKSGLCVEHSVVFSESQKKSMCYLRGSNQRHWVKSPVRWASWLWD